MNLLKYRPAATVVVAILFAAATYADDASSPNNEFRLTLPPGYAAFTRQVQTTKSPEGNIETTSWVSKAPTGEAIVVTMSAMPARILDPQKLITSTRTSLLANLGATLEAEEPRAGEPSTHLQFRSKAAFFRARLTVIDQRLYQLLYVGRSAEQRTAPAVGQIFESFRISNAPGNPE